MKTKILILLAFFTLSVVVPGYAQLNNQKRKAIRAEKKTQAQNKIASLIESKEFVFEAKMAHPSGGPSVDLTTNRNHIKFSPTNIESHMPFFGRAYSIGYGGDAGLKFEGKPEVFTTKKLKNNKGYEIDAKVSKPNDSYDIHLQVGLEGNSTLTILSQQRSSISYHGKILEPEKAE